MRGQFTLPAGMGAILSAAAAAGIAFFLRATADVFVPFTVALVFALAIHPPVDWMLRRRVPSPFPQIIVVLIVLVLLAVALLLMERAIDGVVQILPQFTNRMSALLRAISERLGLAGAPLENLGKEPSAVQTLAGLGGSTALSLINIAFQLLLIFLYLIFLLLGRRHVPRVLRSGIGIERSQSILVAVERIEQQLFKYMLFRIAISLSTALAVWIILAIYGVELAGLWALLTFFAQFVPFIGPIVLSLLPTGMAMVQFPDLSTAAWVALWLSLWHIFVGFVVEPRVFSVGLSLNQTVVLLGLALFGWMWGIVGVLLWVPLMVGLRVVAREIPALKGLDILLGRTNSNEQSAQIT